MTRTLLIVDDDARIRASLARSLREVADVISVAASAEEALKRIGESRPDVVLSDVRMPGLDGMELLRLLRSRTPEVDVILMTAFDDLPLVAAAMHEGATDFLVKPLDLHQLRRLLERVHEDRCARAARGKRNDGAPGATTLVGRDPRMVEIFKVVGQVSGSRTNVVIRGESGTGKELIARAIHDSSPYRAEPFVAVNCTALPSTLLESELFGHVKGAFTGATSDRRGRFAQAGRGSIFLDEIGDTSADFQSKLLRVLQEREFYPVGADRPERTEARVIAATHRDLEALVVSGGFREDLYYRLRVVEIHVPPLRERMADVPQLAEHLVAKASRALGRNPPIISREAVDRLIAHRWPGNVRELENTLTRAVVLVSGDVIRPEHLGLEPRASPRAIEEPRLTTLEQVEREHLEQVWSATRHHKMRTAAILGVSRPRLDRMLRKYGMEEAGTGSGSDEDEDLEDAAT
jgi:two-component system NtrC family response regulator/two-component system response regulator AtoC